MVKKCYGEKTPWRKESFLLQEEHMLSDFARDQNILDQKLNDQNVRDITLSRSAVYCASFDPPTKGHEYIIEQGSKLFDTLIVAVSVNASKKPFFTLEDRVKLLKEITQDLENVSVESFQDQFLVHYAQEKNCKYILRGMRNSVDFEYEQRMHYLNEKISEGTLTNVFLMPPKEIEEISSSVVRSCLGLKGWKEIVKNFVPEAVYQELSKRHT